MSLAMLTQPANQRPGPGRGGIWIPATPPTPSSSTNELVILAPLGALSFTHATLGERSPPATDRLFIMILWADYWCVWTEAVYSLHIYYSFCTVLALYSVKVLLEDHAAFSHRNVKNVKLELFKCFIYRELRYHSSPMHVTPLTLALLFF